MSMQTVLRVEDGKYVAGLGGSTKASQVFMNDGVTSVETAINSLKPIKAIESNDATEIVAWLTAHNTEIPVGTSLIDFKYATGVCSKAAVAVGRIRFVSYYGGLDNKSTSTNNGTWSSIS